jgi:hypothetical protein
MYEEIQCRSNKKRELKEQKRKNENTLRRIMKPWISALSKGLWLCHLSKDIILSNGLANLISFFESRALELATSLNKMLPFALASDYCELDNHVL